MSENCSKQRIVGFHLSRPYLVFAFIKFRQDQLFAVPAWNASALSMLGLQKNTIDPEYLGFVLDFPVLAKS